ncbi:sodium-dependent transporter [Endozoicomonas arenosclerae]|uniref:sodium-dependent transporter n=1 Tax=Endozoicomonas arenosclerae TaxID=1633495 RepID=UPI000783859F|nr:sodium-dependent transporter [Endozoicomonas arenosclerae]
MTSHPPLAKTANPRETFSSNWSFLCTAASSAIGLGNIWSFPTLAAQYGGSAFLIAYIMITFLLAWPLLTLELSAGKYGRSDNIGILKSMTDKGGKPLALWGGYLALAFITTAAALYSVVGGWVLEHAFKSLCELIQIPPSTISLNSFFWALAFLTTTALFSSRGLRSGVERCTRKLLPCFFVLLIIMALYVLQLEHAREGIRAYLEPDFTRAFQSDVLLAALGQSFFSLSLGGTTMLIYGSYLQSKSRTHTLATQVVSADILVSMLAGLMIMPLIYSATHINTNAISEEGVIASGPTLAFDVLPSLFSHMGTIGNLLSLAFFGLLWLAAVTSAISMLEVTVSHFQKKGHSRVSACTYTTAMAATITILLIWGGNNLLMATLKICTQLIQPVLAICVCILAGWFWKRGKMMNALSGKESQSIFWTTFAFYIQWICPLLILILIFSLWK